MKLTHDGDEILIDVSWPNTHQAMAIALMADVTLAEFGSRAQDATRRLLRRISSVMADTGRPMLLHVLGGVEGTLTDVLKPRHGTPCSAEGGLLAVGDDARQLARRIFATLCAGWAFARS
jgi:hypothetical protein